MFIYIMSDKMEPYRMNDGRCFTDYRQSHEVDKQVKKMMCKYNSQCCKNNYNYKICLVNSCDTVKNYLENDNFKNNYSLL